MAYRFQINPDRKKPAGYRRTICDVNREIYRLARDEIAEGNPAAARRLMELAAEGFDMGKRMNAKLVQNKRERQSQ